MKSHPTNQHYVPQFLLRNFASGGGKQIFVFDKAKERTFSASIQRVASKTGFYDCEVGGVAQSIDPALTRVESVTSAIIRKIVGGCSLRGLSGTDRALISLFTSIQQLRTDARRKQLKALIDDLHDVIIRGGWDPGKVRGFEFLNEEQTRVATIVSLRELARERMPYFLNKSWLLYATSHEHPFYIADNPVTLFNANHDPVRSTLGLGVPGIEIYLPLSSTLCLGFLCHTIETTVRENCELAERSGHPVPSDVRELVGALDGDSAVVLNPSNVMHQNSLQVSSAERFVFSENDDFSLAREMLRQLPELKSGPRDN